MTYDAVYTVKEAAKLLKISPEGMYYLLDMEGFPHFMILDQIRIRGSDLESFVENREERERNQEKG